MKLRTTAAGGLLLLGLASGAASAASPLAPSIPQPQPGPAPGTCTRTQGAPDTWTKLLGADAQGGEPNPQPNYEVTVDPWRPCLMYRATSRQDLQRSLDSGRTWQPVFHNSTGVITGAVPSAPADASPFAASDLQVPQQDSLVMAESGNGDAMLRSDDQGHSWQLADGGLEGKHIASVEAAPSNPDVLYAVVDEYQTDPVFQFHDPTNPADPLGLYVSKDGGSTWQPRVFPTALTAAAAENYSRPHLAVDPEDPGRLWMLAQLYTVTDHGGTTINHSAQSVVLQSRDYGTTWQPMSPPGSGVIASQLIAVRTPDHQLRLYYNTTEEENLGEVFVAPPAVSTDAGVSWQPLPVVPLLLSSLAVDPADGNRMVYAGYVRGGPLTALDPTSGGALNTVSYTVTYDSWAHARTGTPLNLGPFSATLPQAPLQGIPQTDDPDVLLQADRFGTFYLLSRHHDDNTVHQALFALTPIGPPGTGPASSPAGGGSGAGGSAGGQPSTPPPGGAQPTQPPVSQMDVLSTCTLPATEARDDYGTLTFDGQYLLYTSSQSVSPPDTGTILRLDPQTCAPAPPLTVQFDPNDLNTVAQTTNAPGQWSTPLIGAVSYDPGHDTIWMSLATGSNAAVGNSPSSKQPVFSATFNHTGGATSSTLTATLRFFADGPFAGLDLLAYDYYNDTLWGRYQGNAAHIGLDGTLLPSCWDPANDKGNAISTWVVGGPGRLYVQSEDDVTLWEVESSTCQLRRTYQHRNFGEPAAENEQLACDALSFGADSKYATAHPAQSAIWLRDALNHLIVAYGMPDGVCPMPTTTKYLGSAASPQRGQTRFCAQLGRRGVVKHLPNKPLVFSVDGRNIGTGTTNAAGVACVDHPMTLANGAYPVVVRFLGDAQYLPSRDTGTFPVTNGAIPPVVAIALPGQPPSSGQPPEPGPASQAQAPQAASQVETQVSSQAQAQVQSQTQAQTHTVAQAQPGVAVQRRTREQVATQTAANTAAQGNTLQAVQFVAAALTLGFGVLRRRPARARAWLRRR